MSGISVWNEHSPKIESALAENKVVARVTLKFTTSQPNCRPFLLYII